MKHRLKLPEETPYSPTQAEVVAFLDGLNGTQMRKLKKIAEGVIQTAKRARAFTKGDSSQPGRVQHRLPRGGPSAPASARGGLPPTSFPWTGAPQGPASQPERCAAPGPSRSWWHDRKVVLYP
jgi:hypothetical protein